MLRVLAVSAFAMGCLGRTTGVIAAVYPAPELVELRRGVHVVVNWGAPVFWAHGAYWLHHDGTWLRSERDRIDWQVAAPPAALRALASPARYAYGHLLDGDDDV